MKPFDLEKALAGHPLVTRDGRSAKKFGKSTGTAYPFSALIEGEQCWFDSSGFWIAESQPDEKDLFLAEPEQNQTMSHDEMIAVIQAHKEGKQIQYRNIGHHLWDDCIGNNPKWAFNNTGYRIKPEPREPRVIWVTEGCDGILSTYNFTDLRLASEHAAKMNMETLKFIEVTAEE